MEKYEQMIKQMAENSEPQLDAKKTALICVDLVNDGSDDNGFFKKVLNFDISLIQKIEPNVIKLIEACKKDSIPIIGVQAIYDFSYIPVSMKERFEAMGIKGGLSPKGSLGAEIIPKIKNIGVDLILVKSYYSSFSPGKTFGYKPGNKEIENYMKLSSDKDDIITREKKKTMLDYFKEAQIIPQDIDSHLDNGGVVSLDCYLKSKGIDTLIICGASTHVCVDSTISGASERGYKIFVPIDAIAAEGIPGEGYERHFVYLSNQGMFKAELTSTERLIKAIEKFSNNSDKEVK